MAQKKASEVDAWLKRPDPEISITLLYGPDRGLVSERARLFADKAGIPLDDPFSVVRMDAGEIDQDPGRLLDEAHMVAMFVAKRLIWIRNAAAQKNLAEAVKLLVADPPVDAAILIEGGDLKKGAALRTAVEAGAASMALPCYADEGRGIDGLIDEALGRAGMSIAMDARQVLRTLLGGDRLASRGELEKLVLFCHRKQRIELSDVAASTGDVGAPSLDDGIDAVLGGDSAALDQAFSRSISAGGAPAVLLGAVARQFQMLQLLRMSMDEGGKTAAAAVAGARPPVFFSRRRVVEQALLRWQGGALSRALERLQTAILQTRKKPEVASAIARQTLFALATEASRLAKK
jgi:DNA polymerase III subunit delta